jgi:hypothetical protein
VSRLFRLLEKKRGERRTVSKWAGGIGEVVFFIALLVLGLAALAVPFFSEKPASFTIGQGLWLSLLVVVALIFGSVTGIVWAILNMGTSEERRLAFAGKARLRLEVKKRSKQKTFPSIPDDDGITNSPGTQLAYRLPPAQSPGWSLLAATSFCVLWNTVSCLLLVWTIGSIISGPFQWFLSAVTILFLAVGGWSINYLLRQVWVHTGLGPTMLEIEEHPLVPGHTYSLVLSQAGNFRMLWMELWLVCEEEATFNQGTDIRTETGRVYEELLFQQEDFLIEPSGSYVRNCTVHIPQEAMHSFQGEHHAIHWRLLVRGSAEGWPEFERAFPIIIHPGSLTRLPRSEASPASLIEPPAIVISASSARASA